MPDSSSPDVLVIGAGPAGAIAAALLNRQGHRVLVLEREQFPRFSIGESLLPQCMVYLAEAGMLAAVDAAGFQRKTGALFQRAGAFSGFDFHDKTSPGPAETYQVRRADFDALLANEAAGQGVDIRYRHEITDIDLGGSRTVVTARLADGTEQQFSADFLLDASGFGRVLPRRLGLERASDFPVRASVFCHLSDGIAEGEFDREQILITVHPRLRDIWFWLISLSPGRCSLGAVAEPALLDSYGTEPGEILRALVAEDPELSRLLANAEWDSEARKIIGFSADVTRLATDRWALLGNAGEFLDPVFSSGVTIAMRSASLAAATLHRQLSGESVDWERDYVQPLQRGVDTFREFVTAWYDGRLQDIIFYARPSPDIRRMICSVLAGYAWDQSNPYVESSRRRLNALSRYCAPERQA